MPPPPRTPNPRRVAAGKLNRLKRKPLTPEVLERFRQSALKHKPWLHSTGPRTPEGKAKMAKNGAKRQTGKRSLRAVKRDRAELRDLLVNMVAARTAARLA